MQLQLSIYLSIYLSVCLFVCLSVYLQLASLKTKQFCETSSFFELDNMKKRSNSARRILGIYKLPRKTDLHKSQSLQFHHYFEGCSPATGVEKTGRKGVISVCATDFRSRWTRPSHIPYQRIVKTTKHWPKGFRLIYLGVKHIWKLSS